MTGQNLKNSILQLAIQGKLVAQDANDEPASVLLESIKAEKKKLVEEKKIKKEKPLAEITEDEKPFEIPDSWVWVRLGEIFIHVSGKQQSTNNKKEGSIRQYITTSNLYWGRFELDVLKSMYFTDEEIKTCSATKGDLLVCEGGAGYGRSAIWPYDYDICLQNHVHRLRPLIKGVCEYVYYIIYLLKETNKLASVGTAMPGLSANRLKEILIPLPPLSEQKRIVAKIEELMPLVDEYDKAQKELDALNSAMPEQLKQSILQEAIMGKLGTNNPDDEPASELLKRIRKEKEQLIKDKKIKKEKPLPEITDEEKPFDIPDNWVWVRLGDIGDWGSGATPSKGKPDYYDKGNIPWIRTGELNNSIVNNSEIKITDKALKECSLRMCKTGDVLIAMYGATIGKVAILNIPATTNQACCACTPIFVFNWFLLYFLMANKKAFTEMSEGGAQPNISKEKILRTCFPLPPLAEQHRIVSKIENLFACIEPLAKDLK